MAGAFRTSLGGYLGLFGGLCGGLSVFNLLAEWRGLDLAEAMALLLSVYRATFHGFIDGLARVFPMDLPTWGKDILVLWLLFGAAVSRTFSSIHDHRFYPALSRDEAYMLERRTRFRRGYLVRFEFIHPQPRSPRDRLRAAGMSALRLVAWPAFLPHLLVHPKSHLRGVRLSDGRVRVDGVSRKRRFYVLDRRLLLLFQAAMAVLAGAVFTALNAFLT